MFSNIIINEKYTLKKNKIKVVAVSGGFDPLHIGHIECLKKAKSLGDKLIIILNSDNYLIEKKGFVFMPAKERAAILSELKCVDEVFHCIDDDMSVCKSLEFLKPDIFANGGDRNQNNIPEFELCNKIGIQMIDGLGNKIQSSSTLIKKLIEKNIK